MQLTNQMLAEIEHIQARVRHVYEKFVKPMEFEILQPEPSTEIISRNRRIIIAELNPCKVRLENILCETDRKEQAHSHLNHLIRIFQLINDPNFRYLQHHHINNELV